MPTLYAPGTTPIAVTPRGFVALEPGASASLLARIRAVVSDGRGLGGVIEALTGAYGASLTAIPSFAVALAEVDGVRLAVRGEFVLEVDAAAPERVSGAGVTTWTERVVAGVSRVALTTEDLDAAAPAEFEIADGVVLAAGIVWDAAATRSSSSPIVAGAPVSARPSGAPAAAPAGGEALGRPGADASPAAEPAPVAAAGPAAATAAATAAPAIAAPAPPTVAPGAAGGARAAASAPSIGVPVPPSGAGAPAGPRTPGSGLIDSNSVPSVADAETLLPSDSTLLSKDAPPSRSGGDAEKPFDEDDAAATAAPSGDEPWAATIIRSMGTPAPAAAAPAPPVAGDHDGATISLAQARALRAEAAADAEFERTAVSSSGTPDALAPPRPPAPGRVRVSTGQVIPLDRTVVIGRRPRSTRVSGTDLPHLVAVDSPQQDISRSHVELRVEGESIVATDLRTTNGTTLLRPGADPVRLHPGEGTVVIAGDVLDLGDGITVAIEGMS